MENNCPFTSILNHLEMIGPNFLHDYSFKKQKKNPNKQKPKHSSKGTLLGARNIILCGLFFQGVYYLINIELTLGQCDISCHVGMNQVLQVHHSLKIPCHIY